MATDVSKVRAGPARRRIYGNSRWTNYARSARLQAHAIAYITVNAALVGDLACDQSGWFLLAHLPHPVLGHRTRVQSVGRVLARTIYRRPHPTRDAAHPAKLTGNVVVRGTRPSRPEKPEEE